MTEKDVKPPPSRYDMNGFCIFRYAYSKPVVIRGATDNTVRLG